MTLTVDPIPLNRRIARARPPVSAFNTAAGFSLVELLVVILIIGLGVQLVSINVGGNDSRQTRQEAKAFVIAATIAAEEAVLSRQQWGVDFYREFEDGEDRYGYRWLTRQEGLWQLAQQREDEPVDVLFSPGVQLRLEFDEIEQDIEQKLDIPDPVDEDDENLTELEKQLAYSEEDKNEIEPHIWMLSSGEMTPFKLFIFDVDDPENKIVINGDELGRVRIENTVIDEDQF